MSGDPQPQASVGGLWPVWVEAVSPRGTATRLGLADFGTQVMSCAVPAQLDHRWHWCSQDQSL